MPSGHNPPDMPNTPETPTTADAKSWSQAEAPANNNAQLQCPLLAKIPPEVRVIIYDFYIINCLFEPQPHRVAKDTRRHGTESRVLAGLLYNDDGLTAPLHFAQKLSTPLVLTCRKIALELRPMPPAYRSMTVQVRPTPQVPAHYFFSPSRWFFALRRSSSCGINADLYTGIRYLHIRVLVAANRNDKPRIEADWAKNTYTIEDLIAGSQSTLRRISIELCLDKSWKPHVKSWAGEDGPLIDLQYLCLDRFMWHLSCKLSALRCVDLHGVFHCCWVDRLEKHYPQAKVERGKAYRRKATRKYDNGADLELCA